MKGNVEASFVSGTLLQTYDTLADWTIWAEYQEIASTGRIFLTFSDNAK